MTNVIQVLLLGTFLRLSLVGTLRPQQVTSLEDDPSAEEPDEAEHAQVEEQATEAAAAAAAAEAAEAGGSVNASTKVFVAGPGDMGIDVEHHTGKIERIYKGGGAERLGWKVGQQIIQVANQNFTFRLYIKITEASAEHSKLYNITIDTAASENVGTMEWVEWYCRLPAGITGATLVLACPWFVYQIVRSGLDAGCKALNQKVMWLLLAVAAGNGIGDFCTAVSSLTVGHFLFATAILSANAGMLLGYLWNLDHPLLDAALSKDMATQVRKADTINLALYCVINFCIFGEVVSVSLLRGHTNNIGAAIAELLFLARYLPLHLLQFKIYWMTSRICAAACQGMLGVAETLPCAAADFRDHVHEPSAKLLKETPPQLATCGVPLILPTLGIPGRILSCYEYLMVFILRKNYVLQHLVFWVPAFFYVCAWICSVALTMCAVAVGPFWLSSSLKDLKAKLNETRRRDPTMHSQVQVVDVMLEQVNRGQGWGVPVFNGFVLSKSTLQTICIRVILAGTLIKAVFDAELGLEEEEEQVENLKLDVIRSTLHNMTLLLHNRTFENASDLIPALQHLVVTMKHQTMKLAHL